MDLSIGPTNVKSESIDRVLGDTSQSEREVKVEYDSTPGEEKRIETFADLIVPEGSYYNINTDEATRNKKTKFSSAEYWSEILTEHINDWSRRWRDDTYLLEFCSDLMEFQDDMRTVTTLSREGYKICEPLFGEKVYDEKVTFGNIEIERDLDEFFSYLTKGEVGVGHGNIVESTVEARSETMRTFTHHLLMTYRERIDDVEWIRAQTEQNQEEDSGSTGTSELSDS